MSVAATPDPVAAVKVELAAGRLLRIDDLTRADLPSLHWSGSPTHLEAVAAALDRVAAGEAEYLVARAPDGTPVAKGGVDYCAHAGAGTIWQLATHPELQSLGIGARLVAAAEDRIRARGLRRAMLGVEVDNPRARHLYERLGYTACGEQPESWIAEGPDGTRFLYETVCTLMRKEL